LTALDNRRHIIEICLGLLSAGATSISFTGKNRVLYTGLGSLVFMAYLSDHLRRLSDGGAIGDNNRQPGARGLHIRSVCQELRKAHRQSFYSKGNSLISRNHRIRAMCLRSLTRLTIFRGRVEGRFRWTGLIDHIGPIDHSAAPPSGAIKTQRGILRFRCKVSNLACFSDLDVFQRDDLQLVMAPSLAYWTKEAAVLSWTP
jgi:hypothetical protein